MADLNSGNYFFQASQDGGSLEQLRVPSSPSFLKSKLVPLIVLLSISSLFREGREAGVYSLHPSPEDTNFFSDWSKDPRFNELRTRNLKLAAEAIQAPDVGQALDCVECWAAPLDYGPFEVLDPEGQTIMRFQLVRSVDGPSWHEKKCDASIIQYYFSCENVPGSPYHLRYINPPDDNPKVSPFAAVFRAGEQVGTFAWPEDSEFRKYGLLFIDINGKVLFSHFFPKEAYVAPSHVDFIRKLTLIEKILEGR